MSGEPKPRKQQPFTRKWWEAARELQLSCAPQVLACVDCNAPVLHGYCCPTCGSGKGGVDEGGSRP